MIPVCPRCDLAMIIMEFSNIEMDYCPQCRGLWLDHGELEDIIAHTGAAVDDPLVGFQAEPASGKSPRNLCPRCDRHMQIVRKSCPDGSILQLDRCPAGHGLWFDAEELRHLMSSFPPECGTGKTVDYLRALLGSEPASKLE